MVEYKVEWLDVAEECEEWEKLLNEWAAAGWLLIIAAQVFDFPVRTSDGQKVMRPRGVRVILKRVHS